MEDDMFREMREVLIDVYLDWRNNYLTYEKYAEHNGLTVNEADRLIQLGREAWQHKHPEA
jgi:hypothetical protein